MGFRENYQNPFEFDIFGIITGTAGVTQFPDIPCSIFTLKARASNVGSFFLSHESGTVNLPYELDAGEETGWVCADNLNRYYHNNPSGTLDYLAYWIQK